MELKELGFWSTGEGESQIAEGIYIDENGKYFIQTNGVVREATQEEVLDWEMMQELVLNMDMEDLVGEYDPSDEKDKKIFVKDYQIFGNPPLYIDKNDVQNAIKQSDKPDKIWVVINETSGTFQGMSADKFNELFNNFEDQK